MEYINENHKTNATVQDTLSSPSPALRLERLLVASLLAAEALRPRTLEVLLHFKADPNEQLGGELRGLAQKAVSLVGSKLSMLDSSVFVILRVIGSF